MADLIDRAKAIKAIEDMQDCYNGFSDTYDKAQIIGVLEELPTAEPQWIPCDEGLPFSEYGESDYVLTTCGYRNVEDTSIRWVKTLYFNGGVWCYPTGEVYEQKVYAWMPLPKPYKENRNG